MKSERENRVVLSESIFYGKQLSRYPKRKQAIPKEELDKAIARQKAETLSVQEY